LRIFITFPSFTNRPPRAQLPSGTSKPLRRLSLELVGNLPGAGPVPPDAQGGAAAPGAPSGGAVRASPEELDRRSSSESSSSVEKKLAGANRTLIFPLPQRKSDAPALNASCIMHRIQAFPLPIRTGRVPLRVSRVGRARAASKILRRPSLTGTPERSSPDVSLLSRELSAELQFSGARLPAACHGPTPPRLPWHRAALPQMRSFVVSEDMHRPSLESHRCIIASVVIRKNRSQMAVFLPPRPPTLQRGLRACRGAARLLGDADPHTRSRSRGGSPRSQSTSAWPSARHVHRTACVHRIVCVHRTVSR